jgi:asparagine synthetase B (glutamine-hydrolysing)
MENVIEWNVGLNDFKKCTLELGEHSHKFTTELLDVPFEYDRNITDIFNDHLSIRQTKYVEVLYSGGLDSELVLLSCLKNNIPVIAITLVIKIDGLTINTHDLYYAEKFCRENDIIHKLIELDADKFFENLTLLLYPLSIAIAKALVLSQGSQ